LYLAIIATFNLMGFAKVGFSSVANLSLQNATQNTSQISFFGNTDFKMMPIFSLCINNPQILHLINISAQSSNGRILYSGYFHTQFLSFGCTRLKH